MLGTQCVAADMKLNKYVSGCVGAMGNLARFDKHTGISLIYG